MCPTTLECPKSTNWDGHQNQQMPQIRKTCQQQVPPGGRIVRDGRSPFKDLRKESLTSQGQGLDSHIFYPAKGTPLQCYLPLPFFPGIRIFLEHLRKPRETDPVFEKNDGWKEWLESTLRTTIFPGTGVGGGFQFYTSPTHDAMVFCVFPSFFGGAWQTRGQKKKLILAHPKWLCLAFETPLPTHPTHICSFLWFFLLKPTTPPPPKKKEKFFLWVFPLNAHQKGVPSKSSFQLRFLGPPASGKTPADGGVIGAWKASIIPSVHVAKGC